MLSRTCEKLDLGMRQLSASAQDPTTHTHSGAGGFLAWWSKARTSLWWIFVIAFLLRLAYILLAHTYKVKPNEDYFSFG